MIAVLIIRVTHTGVYADGRPNPASVTLSDLDEPVGSYLRQRYIPVPVGSFVDVPMSWRSLISYNKGSIRKFVEQGLITASLFIQLRDPQNFGGSDGLGQTLRTAIPNIERVNGVLRIVLPDNVIPTNLDSVGYLVNERVRVSGLTDPSFRNLNGEYRISSVSPGTGLAGPQVGSYLVEIPSPGPDLGAIVHPPGVRLALLDGKITVEFAGSGNAANFGPNVYGYIAGQLLPGVSGGGPGSLAVLDEGIPVDLNTTLLDFVGGAVTASSLGPGAVQVSVTGADGERVARQETQAAHGFLVGQPVYHDGSNWQLALANNGATLATHLVLSVQDANTFTVVQSGFVTGLAGLVPGDYYFTSATLLGGLTNVDPTTLDPSFFSNPMLVAVSPTSGWVVPWRAYGPGTSTGGTRVSLGTTFNDLPSNIQTLLGPADGVMLLETRVLAREQAPGTDRATFKVSARVNWNGGIASVFDVQTDYTSADDPGWSVTFASLGPSVAVQVVGDAISTVDWRIVTSINLF